jgi:hypothetical protein
VDITALRAGVVSTPLSPHAFAAASGLVQAERLQQAPSIADYVRAGSLEPGKSSSSSSSIQRMPSLWTGGAPPRPRLGKPTKPPETLRHDSVTQC